LKIDSGGRKFIWHIQKEVSEIKNKNYLSNSRLIESILPEGGPQGTSQAITLRGLQRRKIVTRL
jgi:hypothetical protein